MTDEPANRVTYGDGRWLELRPMYLKEQFEVIALEQRDEAGAVTYEERVRALAAILERAILRRSDGMDDLMELSEAGFLKLFTRWKDLTEDDAVPPTSATDSAKLPPPPSSDSSKASPSSPSPSRSTTPSSPSQPSGASPHGS